MNRVIALARPLPTTFGRIDPIELMRSVIVLGCAAALILARQPLPF